VGEINWFSKQGDKVNNLKQGDTEKIKCKARRYWKNKIYFFNCDVW
jgi:hypothetical protein